MSEPTPADVTTTIVASGDARSGSIRSLSGEQRDAVVATQPVVALSAGAGSGKTTVLVERFLDLVANKGISPLEILAITYTEKAAAEMKGRVIQRFADVGDDVNRRRSEAAYISTIHGFCARLLRENALAAGVDPRFRIIDRMQSGIFLDEERERLVHDDWYLKTRVLFKRRFSSSQDRLFELIHDCAFKPREFGKALPEEEVFTVEQHVAASMKRLRAYLYAQWQTARTILLEAADLIENCTISGPASTIAHAEMCALISRLPNMAEPDPAWAARYCELTSFTRGLRDPETKDQIREVISSARTIMHDLRSVDMAREEQKERDVIAPIKYGIYTHALELRRRYEMMKFAHSLLDFEDLQRMALHLLEREEVRAEYASAFKHILLDEAQDVNDVQLSIVNALLSGGEQCLFAVGDIKQSVYGFRGADIKLFRDMHRNAGAGRLSLVDNYRSRSELIEAVNAICSQLWRDDASLDYEPLRCEAEYEEVPATPPRVEVMVVERQGADSDGGRDDSVSAHEREALAIAQRIRLYVDGNGATAPLTIYDRTARSRRTVQYRDIAILPSKRTHFAIYERVLNDLGIPAVTDGGRGFFNGREVQDILAAMRVVANPYDDVALLAALRSPLFGWSDADLVALRTAAGPKTLWSALENDFRPHGAFADTGAHRILADLRSVREELSPVQLIQRLLDRTAYLAALLRTRRGRAGVANVNKLLEFSRESTAVDGSDLRRFIERAELAADYLYREQEASVAAEGDDVVSIGTIHGSKGLEWPVVFMVALDASVSGDNGSYFSAADGTLIINPLDSNGNPVTPFSQKPLVEAVKLRTEDEARRLFYVGMTRAREYLTMCGCHKSSKGNSRSNGFREPLKWLATTIGLALDAHEPTVCTVDGATIHVRFITEESVAAMRGAFATHDPKLLEARKQVSQNRAVVWEPPSVARGERIDATIRDILVMGQILSPASRPNAVTTVTQLVYFARCPLVYYFSLVLQIDEHPRRRRRADSDVDRKLTPAEMGTIVHGMLERADLDAPALDEARRLAQSPGAESMSDADREKVQRMLAGVLTDPLIERARTATRLEREYPFYMSVNGATIRGVIDLVFTDANGRGVVIDYKTNDLAAPDRINVLSRYYEPQIEMYALAASRAGLVQPDEATLYFLNGPEARTTTINGERLATVEATMSDALARISSNAWDTEPGEKCRHCGYRKRGFCEVGKRFVE